MLPLTMPLLETKLFDYYGGGTGVSGSFYCASCDAMVPAKKLLSGFDVC